LSLPPSLGHFQLSRSLCCCAKLKFVVYCSGFFFLGGVSLPRGCAGLSQGRLGRFCMICGTHLFSL
jgi:hypothetical protein